jgi:hypothetical protein
MTWWVAGSAMVASAGIGAYSSRQASKAQERAAAQGDAAQERMFNRQVELQEPFRQAGVNALPELVEASRYTPFGMEQFQQDPGYQFRLKEGLRALEQRAAAEGTRVSGNQLRGLVRYGQNLASQDWINSFNRYQAERAARLNPLQSLAGMGQSTAATLGQQAGQYGQSMAQGAAQMGNIRASGYTNQANALSGALGQGVNYYQNQQMMDRFFPEQDSRLMRLSGSSDYSKYLF